MIAIWHYIDEDRVTQNFGERGFRAPNLLERSATFHSIGTRSNSSGGDRTPVTPRTSRASSRQSSRSRSRGSGPTEPTQEPQNRFQRWLGYFSSYMERGSRVYHVQTRLPDGRIAIIVDPGSVGNLGGDKWCKDVAVSGARAGKKPTYKKRPKPLSVSGVGHGSQQCNYDCHLPIALRHDRTNDVSHGEITLPAVQGSDMPGLLGNQSLIDNKAIWDFENMKLYFVGPGEYDLEKALPPGTDVFQLERAPSGHIVLPICEFDGSPSKPEHTLTLMTRRGNSGGRPTEAEASSSSSRVPPPPAAPPVLPSTSDSQPSLPPPPASLAMVLCHT